MPFKNGVALEPILDKAKPNNTEKNNTCKILLVAKAFTILSGIICKKKSATVLLLLSVM